VTGSKIDKLKDVVHNVFGTVLIVVLIKSERIFWVGNSLLMKDKLYTNYRL